MRIQHNVTALNAYRNLRGNNSSLAKNLEKLSSGYRINRAGDDAAGLAVSEKMRAQITGLEAATKNAQDGISLIQTAEGALTEVHSMLNRMASLATQSANGTYDNEVDRANLQKEVVSLKKEIDRISESSNYNGIKLLDGSMSNESLNRGAIKAQMNNSITSADLNAVAGSQEVVARALANANDLKDGETLSMSFNYKDENGNDKVKTINLKADITNKKLIDEDGNETTLATNDGKVTVKEIHTAIKNVLAKDKEFNKQFDVKVEDTKITFTAKKAGVSGATITGASQYIRNTEGALTAAEHDQLKVEGKTVAADAGVAYKFANAKVFGGAQGVTDINKALFEVNGEKFLFTSQDLTEEQWKQVRESGAHIVTTDGATPNPADTDVKEMARRISEVTGLQAEAGAEAANKFTVGAGTDLRIQHSGKAVDRSLTLQIGDTADEFNKMKVSVQSTSAKNLKIADVDISTQAGAADAIGKIKNAINSVSSTRGDLGALQNRLDHTINNLGVMHENITEAESRIRDTDMAKEMMAYAKNNILVQSATAMLAQANQLPQGVLQLLQ